MPAARSAPAEPSPATAPVETATDAPASDTAEPAAAPAAAQEPTGAAAGEPPGMAQVRKAEQHLRRKLAEERAQMLADIELQKSGWQAKLEKAEAIDRAVSAARKDPVAALKALGFSEDEFDALGRMIYAHTPEGQKDPKFRASAEAMLREREGRTAVEKLQAELAELKGTLTAREQQAQAQTQLDAYAADLTKAVGDQTPLAKAALAKAPAKAKQALLEIADRLYMASGPSHDLRDIPTAAEVLQAYEAQRSAELEELGIDPKSIGRPAAVATPAPRPTTTIAPSGTAAPIAPKAKMTREEMLAEMAKMAKQRGAV